jgi:hypothetical protein
MNPQREEDLQRRLENLEAEINSSPRKFTQKEEKTQASQPNFPGLNFHLERFALLFNGLSQTGKLVVSGVALLFGFAILQAVLKLVASIISLALLAVLVYLGYKFFVSNSLRHK